MAFNHAAVQGQKLIGEAELFEHGKLPINIEIKTRQETGHIRRGGEILFGEDRLIIMISDHGHAQGVLRVPHKPKMPAVSGRQIQEWQGEWHHDRQTDIDQMVSQAHDQP
jgi:hypothetical protein